MLGVSLKQNITKKISGFLPAKCSLLHVGRRCGELFKKGKELHTCSCGGKDTYSYWCSTTQHCMRPFKNMDFIYWRIHTYRLLGQIQRVKELFTKTVCKMRWSCGNMQTTDQACCSTSNAGNYWHRVVIVGWKRWGSFQYFMTSNSYILNSEHNLKSETLRYIGVIAVNWILIPQLLKGSRYPIRSLLMMTSMHRSNQDEADKERKLTKLQPL